MIGPVRIKNFKSIRDLGFEAKRVNLFIGEPNTGKSNIIEALAFFSSGVAKAFREILRFKTTADLFFDQKVANQLTVQAGIWGMSLVFRDGSYRGAFREESVEKAAFLMDHTRLLSGGEGLLTSIRYYLFKPLASFPSGQPGVLNPPFGDNLVAILYSNERLRQRVGSIFRSQGFRLQLKPTENELLIAKDVNDELYSYPWTSVSETLRRVVFFMAVLETNQNSTLLIDEPETNTFPFYTKYLAERIALDDSNQFLITTHNPYLLSSVVEKTQSKDLAVFVTRMENFETKVKQVPGKCLPELLELDSDAFFILDRLVDE
ncbi:MAG: AAA family ATPase [Chloroflexi bacterium]|nr:AAA family ATPase [Chloroflexota bacterium]